MLKILTPFLALLLLLGACAPGGEDAPPETDGTEQLGPDEDPEEPTDGL